MQQLPMSIFSVVLGAVCGTVVTAQEVDPIGIYWGNFIFEPEVRGTAAYDNRVLYDEAADEREGDFYGEVAAGVRIKNAPAIYALTADAEYGRRYYVDVSDQNDDFYTAAIGAARNNEEGAGLRVGASASLVKSLNFNYIYDSETGDRPDSIVTSTVNERLQAEGKLGYAIPLGTKTLLVPEVRALHYYQEFEGTNATAEWQTYDASIALNYLYSEKLTLLAGVFYTLQTNDDEDGYIITAGVGARGRLSEKTRWSLVGGVAHVDYEVSGADEGGVLDATLDWQAAEKVNAYLFYGNSYDPAYGGGRARLVYRAGYGADWAISTRWIFNAQMLHDYTDEVGSGDSSDFYGNVNHYFTTSLGYSPSRSLTVFLTYQFVNDRLDTDQQTVALSGLYRF